MALCFSTTGKLFGDNQHGFGLGKSAETVESNKKNRVHTAVMFLDALRMHTCIQTTRFFSLFCCSYRVSSKENLTGRTNRHHSKIPLVRTTAMGAEKIDV